MLVLIKHGEVYDPEPIGPASILIANDRIAKIGSIDESAVHRLGLDFEVVDATGCIVAPGLIDPHVHLIGAGGEGGFATRVPEVQLSELLRAGMTTIVGCLGTAGTTRSLTALLAKARGLEEEGITTYIYTGNFEVPPPTITDSVQNDVVLLDKVIGAGEIAIADWRSAEPSPRELARLVYETSVGGLLSGKAGVTHFHTGSGKQRLGLLHRLLEEFEIEAKYLYPAHVSRSEALMDDAIALAKKGAFVDMDTTEGGLARWLTYYREHGGVATQLTISSDGHTALPQHDGEGREIGLRPATPYTTYQQVVDCIVEHGMAPEDVLPYLTVNPAKALQLRNKGRLREGMDADVLVLRKPKLAIEHLFARGRPMIKDARLLAKGTFE
jgi:beta-aspartyl-dipeptidase (metallo-type)